MDVLSMDLKVTIRSPKLSIYNGFGLGRLWATEDEPHLAVCERDLSFEIKQMVGRHLIRNRLPSLGVAEGLLSSKT